MARSQDNSWRALAKKALTVAEQKRMRASYDVVGDIAIVEIARGLEKKEKKLAQLLLASQPSIKVVAKKLGKHVGTFRRQPLLVIAGEPRHVTTHTENGCRFRLDVSRCYFSPRMGTERLRVARLVKKGENVLVLFAGIAPFPIVVAKHARPLHVDSIELNPTAIIYAKQNVALNKVESVVNVVRMDAAKFLSQTKERYDRILLAWPGHAALYLPAAIKRLKRGGAVHYYDFAKAGEFNIAADKVRNACAEADRRCTVLRVVACGQHRPHVNRVCVDAVVR